MNKLATAIAFIALIGTPAFGADMPLKAPPLPSEPVYSWTGGYVGGNIGYGWSHRDFTNTIVGTLGNVQNSAVNTGTDDGKGWLGGGQIGFNYQFPNNWVVGIDADIDAAHITSSTASCFTALIGVVTCGTRDTDLKDFGTVRGRLGYGINNVLLYGTGGWAWGRGTNTTQINCIGPSCPATSGVPPTSPAPTSVNVNPNGWVAGGGVEWGFLSNWTLRAEYLHLQFDGVTEDRSKPGFFQSLVISTHVASNVSTDLVRVGLNYRFR